MIKYEEIEAEVRCGRYYLSVWVEQSKQKSGVLFEIPHFEEQEFHSKMKTELKQWINEDMDKSGSQDKLIILLKSCLLALKKFEEKRIKCLAEIKQILLDTAKSQPGNDDEAKLHKKTILFTSLRIISMAINSDQYNRGEVLAMNGVGFIHDIITHILQ